MIPRFTPPDSARAERELATTIVRVVCLVLLLPVGVNLVRAFLYPALAAEHLLAAGGIGGAALLAALITAVGRPRLAGYVLVGVIFLTLIAVARSGGGVVSPAYIGLLSLTFLSVWLVGLSGAALLVVASAIFGYVLLQAGPTLFTTSGAPLDTGLLWQSLLIQMLLTVLVQWALIRQVHRSTAVRLQSEERFRATFEQAAVGMAHIDLAGRFLRVNSRLCAITGHSSAGLLGLTLADLTHPDDHGDDEALLAQLLAGTLPTYTIEKRFIHQDDTVIWVNLTLSPILGPDGVIGELLVVVEEITGRKLHEWTLEKLNAGLEERVAERTAALRVANEHLQAEVSSRRQAEQALRESEARFRRLADNAPDIIYRFEYVPRQGFVYVSPSFEAITGYTPDECYTNPMISRRLMHPDDMGLVDRFHTDPESLRGPLEMRWLHRDGTLIWIEQRNVTIYDEQGALVAIEGIARDITARKRSVEALRESDVRYRDLLTNLRQGVVVLQEDRIAFCNNALADILGTTVEHLLSCSVGELLELVYVHDRQRLMETLAATYNRGFLVSDDPFRFSRSDDGAVRWIHTATSLISYEGRTAMLSVLSDITDLKTTEESLRKSRDALQEANVELARAARLKDEFLANMSHELRTPLNTILGRAELLAEEVQGPLNERQRRSVASIEESGRHLLELINDILDLSKIEANKLELEHELVSLSDLCEASIRLVAEVARKKEIIISADLDPQVVLLLGDPRRLKQILVNLLANAVKFTPLGGSVGLEVRGDRERQVVMFTIWDTGIGIANADLPRLFRPFEQLDSKINRQFDGTGLGLSLVSRLTHLHGGDVAVSSTPGQGSRFTVTLPWHPH